VTWTILLVAAIFECIGAVSLKASDGFRDRVATGRFVVAMGLSMGLLSWSARTLPIGTAYAVWTGIGAVGTAVWGMWRLGESKAPARIACLALIITGVTLLRATG
jgi:quaternary ammonium compound-resistance protein SugE